MVQRSNHSVWGSEAKACSQCGTEGVSDHWLISANPLKSSTGGKDKAKGKEHASKQSGGSSSQSMQCLHTYVCQILSHLSTLLLIPHTTPLTVTPQTDSLQQAVLIYLQSRKPEVPSGPAGWRITWLFGRTCSDSCCPLPRDGLMIWMKENNFFLKN